MVIAFFICSLTKETSMPISGKFGIKRTIQAVSNRLINLPIGVSSKRVSLPNEPYKNCGIARKFQVINNITTTAIKTDFFRLSVCHYCPLISTFVSKETIRQLAESKNFYFFLYFIIAYLRKSFSNKNH